MKFLILLLGFVPLGLGKLLDWAMLSNPDIALPLLPIGIVFFLFWALLAFMLQPCVHFSGEVVWRLNLVAMLDLILVAIQDLALAEFWEGTIGYWSQIFFLPGLNIGCSLTLWSSRIFAGYAAVFLLMVLASALGAKLRKKPAEKPQKKEPNQEKPKA